MPEEREHDADDMTATQDGFHQRLGFTSYGDEFMDAGIPRLRMKNC